MSYTMTVKGAPPAIPVTGIQGMIAAKKVPRVGESRYPGDKYYHGLARFPNDPTAFTTSEKDWNEKRRQRGMTKRIDDVI